MVNWKEVTKPKKVGGLGMREARLTNISLLGKLVWALEHHKDKFWVQVVATRYLKDNYLLGA